MRANSFNTGIASEYLILSKLYRLDLEAYISQGNKKSVDIRVIRNDGKSISIDVKSVRGYSSLVVNNVKSKPDHFIVFVIYNNKFENVQIEPDIYVVPSINVAEITQEFGTEKRVMKGKLDEYKDRWDDLQNNYGEEGWKEESPEEKILSTFATVMDLQKIDYSREEICNYLSITDEELANLEDHYKQLTANLNN